MSEPHLCCYFVLWFMVLVPVVVMVVVGGVGDWSQLVSDGEGLVATGNPTSFVTDGCRWWRRCLILDQWMVGSYRKNVYQYYCTPYTSLSAMSWWSMMINEWFWVDLTCGIARNLIAEWKSPQPFGLWNDRSEWLIIVFMDSHSLLLTVITRFWGLWMRLRDRKSVV